MTHTPTSPRPTRQPTSSRRRKVLRSCRRRAGGRNRVGIRGWTPGASATCPGRAIGRGRRLVGDVRAAESIAPSRLVLAYLSSCPTRSLISDWEGGGFLRPREGRRRRPAERAWRRRCAASPRGLERRADERVRDGTDGRGRVRAEGTGSSRRWGNFRDGVLTSNLCATIARGPRALRSPRCRHHHRRTMNTPLRPAALFGMMARERGPSLDGSGEEVLSGLRSSIQPSSWGPVGTL